MRRFVIVGQKAPASADFLLDDLPGTSGRLDVLLRCVRAAMLVSHGLRRDSSVFLVLGGNPRAQRVLRFDGSRIHYLRPDERSLAVLAKKALSVECDPAKGEFVEVRPGVAVARGGLESVLAHIDTETLFVLTEGAPDIREIDGLTRPEAVFVLGDHLGLELETVALLATAGGRPISIGPLSVHAEDAVAIVSNELDRRSNDRTQRA
jgi:tRNA (pseudouridine54-N1)-methyltransferase